MTQFFYLYTDEEMNQFRVNESIKLGRLTNGNQMRVHYARCGVAGCPKEYRICTILGDYIHIDGDEVPHAYSVEHVEGTDHEHAAADVVNRGVYIETRKIKNAHIICLKHLI